MPLEMVLLATTVVFLTSLIVFLASICDKYHFEIETPDYMIKYSAYAFFISLAYLVLIASNVTVKEVVFQQVELHKGYATIPHLDINLNKRLESNFNKGDFVKITKYNTLYAPFPIYISDTIQK